MFSKKTCSRNSKNVPFSKNVRVFKILFGRFKRSSHFSKMFAYPKTVLPFKKCSSFLKKCSYFAVFLGSLKIVSVSIELFEFFQIYTISERVRGFIQNSLFLQNNISRLKTFLSALGLVLKYLCFPPKHLAQVVGVLLVLQVVLCSNLVARTIFWNLTEEEKKS